MLQLKRPVNCGHLDMVALAFSCGCVTVPTKCRNVDPFFFFFNFYDYGIYMGSKPIHQLINMGLAIDNNPICRKLNFFQSNYNVV